jgi:hypothetical protein
VLLPTFVKLSTLARLRASGVAPAAAARSVAVAAAFERSVAAMPPVGKRGELGICIWPSRVIESCGPEEGGREAGMKRSCLGHAGRREAA